MDGIRPVLLLSREDYAARYPRVAGGNYGESDGVAAMNRAIWIRNVEPQPFPFGMPDRFEADGLVPTMVAIASGDYQERRRQRERADAARLANSFRGLICAYNRPSFP